MFKFSGLTAHSSNIAHAPLLYCDIVSFLFLSKRYLKLLNESYGKLRYIIMIELHFLQFYIYNL